MAELKALARRCRRGDKVYFHFSGHGQPVRDDNCDEGPAGELFVVVDACFGRGIRKDEMTDIAPELLLYMRGTNYPFAPPKPLKIKKPKGYTKGAKLTVVTACRENERNIEYRSANGKMYGPLSFYVSQLLKSDADFERWRKCFFTESYRGRGIFQNFQHPSIVIYE